MWYRGRKKAGPTRVGKKIVFFWRPRNSRDNYRHPKKGVYVILLLYVRPFINFILARFFSPVPPARFLFLAVVSAF